ncbi:MAG TPA: hypothetical protein VMV09_03540 [Candidatus Saccharimonadales bacterium]|nr:hypothetical protein [Candidatus Saccharimonadales bacterium]
MARQPLRELEPTLAWYVSVIVVTAGLLLIAGSGMTSVRIQPAQPHGASALGACGLGCFPVSTYPPAPKPAPVILAPATVPSVPGVCSQRLTFGADGSVSPVICDTPPDAVNALAWNYLAQSYANVLAAGPNPSMGTINQMLCSDARTEWLKRGATRGSFGALRDVQATTDGPFFMQQGRAFLAATAYYGWHFPASATREGVPIGVC